MDQKYIIEIACTGNSGRSPQAEAIGNHLVKDSDLENKLTFISSGTNADPKFDEYLPYEKVVTILGFASQYGLMKKTEVDEAEYAMDGNYRAAIESKVHLAFKIMRPIEAALRDAALSDWGLEYDGKRKQTVPRDDVSVVLGMTQKHKEQIESIYLTEKQKPIISTVNEYAGIQGDIPDAIGNPNPSAYRLIRDELFDTMPKVIEQFRKGFLQ